MAGITRIGYVISNGVRNRLARRAKGKVGWQNEQQRGSGRLPSTSLDPDNGRGFLPLVEMTFVAVSFRTK